MEPCTSKTVNYESDSSNDSTAERCPICLLSMVHDQEIGKPSVCDHTFCFPCIQVLCISANTPSLIGY